MVTDKRGEGFCPGSLCEECTDKSCNFHQKLEAMNARAWHYHFWCVHQVIDKGQTVLSGIVYGENERSVVGEHPSEWAGCI